MRAFRGLGAILYKEFIVIARDPTTLFFMLFPPLIEMIAFGYALDTDVKRMRLAVYDEDRTWESRRFVERFVNTETFRVWERVGSLAELEALIRAGKVYAGVQIPPGFESDLLAGRPAALQVLIDGSNSTTALQALNTSVAIALRESLERLMAETGRRAPPVDLRPQMLFNPSMKSPNFFIPGVIGIVLQIATTVATAIAVVRERERGTLEQLLVSPVTRWGLMLGKIVPFLCIGMGMAVLLFALMRYLFGVVIAGSVAMLLAGSFFYVFALLSVGLLISTRAENQMQALQMSMTILLPSVFFSGFIFPRETMPWVFWAVGAVLPATYYIDLLRGVILRGATLADYWPSVAVLAAMAALLFLACARRFRKRLG